MIDSKRLFIPTCNSRVHKMLPLSTLSNPKDMPVLLPRFQSNLILKKKSFNFAK